MHGVYTLWEENLSVGWVIFCRPRCPFKGEIVCSLVHVTGSLNHWSHLKSCLTFWYRLDCGTPMLKPPSLPLTQDWEEGQVQPPQGLQRRCGHRLHQREERQVQQEGRALLRQIHGWDQTEPGERHGCLRDALRILLYSYMGCSEANDASKVKRLVMYIQYKLHVSITVLSIVIWSYMVCIVTQVFWRCFLYF